MGKSPEPFLSVFDVFKIGIGPSSSHTVGPMKAAYAFADRLKTAGLLDRIDTVRCRLYGSLAFTGDGHGTHKAIILGLAGNRPDRIDPADVDRVIEAVRHTGRLHLAGERDIPFTFADNLIPEFEERLPNHPNGMRFTAEDDFGAIADELICYSVGGGRVEAADGTEVCGHEVVITAPPHPYRSGVDLLQACTGAGLDIARLVLANEVSARSEAEVRAHLDAVIDVMFGSVDRGIATTGTLPGGLNVRRRAAGLADKLAARAGVNRRPPHEALEWATLFAIAVNEENAAGGKVVTAPTNGASGTVPAVMRYYAHHYEDHTQADLHTFLLTAAGVGILFMSNSSISGAEVGCQGEVGVASAMAAAGLAAVLGGTTAQVENAAEIAMEHHLGMTCDPVGGLVQIPCIERNAMGAVKAINACAMALNGTGEHVVSLDTVIMTMHQTGLDMSEKYKETSKGGLAVNVAEC